MDIIIQSATYSSTQGIQKKARPTLPWVKGSRLAVQNSFPNDLVSTPRTPARCIPYRENGAVQRDARAAQEQEGVRRQR